MSNDYKQGDTIYILMKRENAEELLDDWMRHGYECDLHIHKSKLCFPSKTRVSTTYTPQTFNSERYRLIFPFYF